MAGGAVIPAKRCVVGEQPLLAMRRRGLKPADGVVLLAGLMVSQTEVARTWHRSGSSMAVVMVTNTEPPWQPDLRCVHALPVLLVTDIHRDKQRLRTLVHLVLSHAPASLALLRLDLVGWDVPLQAVDAFEIASDGTPTRCDEQRLYRRVYG